jgi:zinc finger SWIM domain-containing protein 3
MMSLEYNDIVRMVFDDEKQAYGFYNNYAFGIGFSIRKDYCEWDKGHNGKTLGLRHFVCSCEGLREEKHLMRENKKRKPRDITRFGCPARLVIAWDQDTRLFHVKRFIYVHNHRLLERDLACFLRSHRRIRDEQKVDIVEMQISGIRKQKIIDVMEKHYGGYDKVGFTKRDLYNFYHRNKVDIVAAGDAHTVINYLTECRHRNHDFFFDYRTDEKGHLKGLLWCDT